MKLRIDSSSNQKTTVGLDDRILEQDSTVWRSQVVLPMVEELLKGRKATVKDITEIEVAPGPGSYTGLRVGVAIANALGYALGIPVNGKKITQDQIVEPVYE